ncbi:MAG TPA: hypothetical protein PLW34_07115 [Termitinemataceae bacterium]|nr:hypothetical protein [Termitinemataceae bacterium]HPQ00640.1 hypothetical protein [Termitinemataceae bacterium]
MLRRFFFIVTLGSLIAITAMAQNPYRLYSFFSFDVAPANATSYFTTDQSFSFPLISNLSLVVAGEWKSPLSETFFTNPPRFGLRGGAVYVFPDTGIYIDGLIGWIRHNKQDPLSQNNFATDSIFYELGFNWENSYLYVGVRERLLTSSPCTDVVMAAGTNNLYFPSPYSMVPVRILDRVVGRKPGDRKRCAPYPGYSGRNYCPFSEGTTTIPSGPRYHL